VTGFAIAGIGTARVDFRDRTTHRRTLLRRAVEQAIADSGLERSEIDGYLTAMAPVDDVRFLGLSPGFVASVDSGGASPAAAIISAIGAISAGVATAVLCTFASTVGPTSGSIGEVSHRFPSLWGMSGAVTAHALLARRYLHTYGLSDEALGAVALAQRELAQNRDDAAYQGLPLTLDQYLESPFVVDPLRRLDCCRDANVGAALVITRAEVARDHRNDVVRIAGLGTGENLRNWHAGLAFDRHDDITPARDRALAQAGVTLADVDNAQLYDPFTISVLMQLEEYGFCQPGEAPAYIESGATRPEGTLPLNTGGGQLSGWYAIGFTPIVEAVRQLRGLAGSSQVPGATTALVSNHGGSSGIPNTYHHVTMILQSGD